jgi:ADP-ribose pyrophosphatase
MAVKRAGLFAIRSSREILRARVFTVRREKAVEPGGIAVEREVVHHSGSAVMLARDEQGRILLVRQFRLPARRKLWELPAGRLNNRETPLRAAQRELEEETGYHARSWKRLVAFYPSPGYCTEYMTVYLAEGLTPGATHPDEDELIETRWFTPEQVRQMIARGRIEDGKTLAGVLFLFAFQK